MNIDRETLRRLSSDPGRALELGKAAEHLVCADLILLGYRCYLSDQGLPYDIVVDIDGRLIRIQVKSTCFPKNVNKAGLRERVAYSWDVRRRGKNGKGARLDETHCDVVALVALDIFTIAYLPRQICGETAQLVPPLYALKTKFKSGTQWARTVSEFPFAESISGDLGSYKSAKRAQTHCLHGHEFTPENTYKYASGVRTCRTCQLLYHAKKKADRLASNGHLEI